MRQRRRLNNYKNYIVILDWTSIFGNRFIYIREFVCCAFAYNFIGLYLDNCRREPSHRTWFYRFFFVRSLSLFPQIYRISCAQETHVSLFYVIPIDSVCSSFFFFELFRFGSSVSDNCLWPVRFYSVASLRRSIVFFQMQTVFSSIYSQCKQCSQTKKKSIIMFFALVQATQYPTINREDFMFLSHKIAFLCNSVKCIFIKQIR